MPKTWGTGPWTVTTNKGPILDSAAMDAAETRLAIPVPEMIFGGAEVTIAHSSGWSLRFEALDALDVVNKTGDGPDQITVSYSEAWRKSRQGKSAHDVSKVHRPFDWTYSTRYKGTESSPKLTSDNSVEIPIEKLKQRKPIVLYDEVPLFEDELGDNGLITYTGKIRVMETEMLALVRMYLRVDNVVFRVRDTRVYVDFETNQVIRSYTEKEDTFDHVQRKVPVGTKDHTQLLRDPVWIDSILPIIHQETSTVTF